MGKLGGWAFGLAPKVEFAGETRHRQTFVVPLLVFVRLCLALFLLQHPSFCLLAASLCVCFIFSCVSSLPIPLFCLCLIISFLISHSHISLTAPFAFLSLAFSLFPISIAHPVSLSSFSSFCLYFSKIFTYLFIYERESRMSESTMGEGW